jgi:hypothetical protein
MGRITALSAGGKPIGCRFYADQDPSYRASEHLPGPNQPVMQIVSSHYADATAAHNATVRIAQAGHNAYQANLGVGIEGISFQTRFDPADGNRDWAYAFRKGKRGSWWTPCRSTRRSTPGPWRPTSRGSSDRGATESTDLGTPQT